jgi:twinkle protein
MKLSEKHAEWLENTRHLSIDVCEKFDLQSKGRDLGFPYYERGALAYTKYRRIDKSGMRVSPPGVRPVLYNIDQLSEPYGKGETLVICEGELDCIAVNHAGHHGVSVPNGAPGQIGEGEIDPFNDTQFAYLWIDGKLHPNVAKFDRIVLFGDRDGPGHALNQELSFRIGREKCFIPEIPDDCKDANDILIRHGVEGLAVIIRDAKPIIPPRLVSFGDVQMVERNVGLSPGWRSLDQHLRLTFPELVTVTGVPNAGKSQWTLSWLCNLARDHGIKSAILQLEDNPARNKNDILDYARAFKYDDPAAWMDEHFVTKIPPEDGGDDDPLTLEWLRESMIEAVRIHDCKVIMLDPWNEVEHVFKRGVTETQYVNNALRELKRLTRQLQCAIVIVAHPSMSVRDKPIEDITLYDIAGSAAWNNKSDHGIIIAREEDTDQTIVKVAKCKDFKSMGYPGQANLRFVISDARFEEVRKHENMR